MDMFPWLYTWGLRSTSLHSVVASVSSEWYIRLSDPWAVPSVPSYTFLTPFIMPEGDRTLKIQYEEVKKYGQQVASYFVGQVYSILYAFRFRLCTNFLALKPRTSSSWQAFSTRLSSRIWKKLEMLSTRKTRQVHGCDMLPYWSIDHRTSSLLRHKIHNHSSVVWIGSNLYWANYLNTWGSITSRFTPPGTWLIWRASPAWYETNISYWLHLTPF